MRATAGLEDVDEHRRWLIGTIRDVTDERRADGQIAAHVAVAEALAGWTTFDASAPRLLRDVATALDFSVAALWVPDGDVLEPRVMWTDPTADVAAFERVTRELRLPRGIGLPGRAWETAEPVHLVRAGATDWTSLRSDVAARDGLRAGYAVPAVCGGDVLAVTEFHARDDTECSERLMRSLTGVGRVLGAFLARRRAQLEKRLLSPRELEVLQLATEGLTGRGIADRLMLSPATVKTHFEHVYEKLGVSDRAAAVARALRTGLID
jgi:two-component system sensor histidine kinase/response regulator